MPSPGHLPPVGTRLPTAPPDDGGAVLGEGGPVPGGDCPDPDGCTFQDLLDRVAGKWSVCILVAAADGPIRFTELERRVSGISRRMLTLTLRNLERDGMLVRTAFPVVPPRVEYRLTPMARELHTALVEITAWAERHQADVAAARRRYDTRAT